ncbi:MAG: HAD family hydrolase, partial [Rhodobacteraceae bacterium]|nr:HAD family hydrolase [Paracoccaceae bacterium]
MKIKALLFDKDGTLFDFHRSWGPWLAEFISTVSADEAHGCRLAEALGFEPKTQRFQPGSVFVHDTLEQILDVLLPHLPDWERSTLEAYAIREAARVPQVPTVNLAPLLLSFRARGLVLGVATNDNEHPAKTQLEAAGVLGVFDFVAGYDSGYGGKPATGMQRAFCAAHGLAPAEVAMVGDSLHDMISGRDAGMVTVGVLTGTTSRAELEAVADVVLADIGEIGGW